MLFSRRKLSVVTYAYIILPIIVFFVGWLKLFIAIPCSLLLVLGFIWIYHREKNNTKSYYISRNMLLVLVIVILIWMLVCGTSGYFSVQRSDLHWRNATFRDLIDYSWPVVYPETENALVYYFVFWMIPAVFGKIFGYAVGNAVLFLWVFTGLFLTSIYLCSALKVKNVKELSIYLCVLIIWGGLNVIGQLIAYVITGNIASWDVYFVWIHILTPGLQYTPNNDLLAWCYNQVIVPWLVTAMFIDDEQKNVNKLAYLGLCVLPYAPIPFCGLLIIFLAWGIHQLFINYKGELKKWFIDVLSLPNIFAIISIVPVFLLFYSSNSATSGVNGAGGVGLYMKISDFTFTRWIYLILFLILEFACYSIVIYRQRKTSFLFWVVNVSLILIPLFRIGEGEDFCMRASIPALFMLMFWVIQFILTEKEKGINIGITTLIAFLTVALMGTISDWGISLHDMVASHSISIPADSIQTFSDKVPIALTRGCDLNNYLTENIEAYPFFRYFAKNKSIKSNALDMQHSQSWKEKCGYEFVSGYYRIAPISDSSLCIGWDSQDALVLTDKKQDILLSTEDGFYQISFPGNNLAWTIRNCTPEQKGSISLEPRQNNAEQMSWRIKKDNDSYVILFNDELAVTYENEKIFLDEYTGKNNQKWEITKE